MFVEFFSSVLNQERRVQSNIQIHYQEDWYCDEVFGKNKLGLTEKPGTYDYSDEGGNGHQSETNEGIIYILCSFIAPQTSRD